MSTTALLIINLIPDFLIVSAIVIVAHWIWLFGIKKGGHQPSPVAVSSKKGYQTGGSATAPGLVDLPTETQFISRPSLSDQVGSASFTPAPSDGVAARNASSAGKPQSTAQSDAGNSRQELQSTANQSAGTSPRPQSASAINQPGSPANRIPENGRSPQSDFRLQSISGDEGKSPTNPPQVLEIRAARAITAFPDNQDYDEQHQRILERFAGKSLVQEIEALNQGLSYPDEIEELNDLAVFTQSTQSETLIYSKSATSQLPLIN